MAIASFDPLQPGALWRHRDGGLYEIVLPLVMNATNGKQDGEPMVVYRSFHTRQAFTRSAKEFFRNFRVVV
jgi:hypothetical protein